MSIPDMWVITDHPKDLPNHFVARRWVHGVPTAEGLVSQHLENLRARMEAMGLVCIPRDECDDPVIVESWL
jgi:hypothetical protein